MKTDPKTKTTDPKPVRSLLPNSSPHILLPMAGKGGTFQVVWWPEADTHALIFKAATSRLIATHHNGYSCHALAERIINRDLAYATDQLNFIRRCGGTACESLEHFFA